MFLSVSLAAPSAFAEEQKEQKQKLKKHILVITSQPYVTDWFVALNDSMREKLFSFLTSDSKLSYEYIGNESLTDTEYDTILTNLLRKKYANIKLDMVIAVMPIGIQFILDHGESFYPGKAAIFVLPSKAQYPKIAVRTQSGLIRSTSDAIPETIERIRTLLPETEHLVVVSGSGMDDLYYLSLTEEILKNKKWPNTVEYLRGLPIENLAERLQKLPHRSAVLMLTYLQDQAGLPVTTVQVMKSISARTAVPIFSFYDTIFGLGIVGGKLTSAEAYGEAAAAMVLKMFQEGEASPLAETVVKPLDMYDWRQLDKWNIPVERLPANSEIYYRKVTYFQEHLGMIVLAASIIVLQALLILALLFNLARRRRAEAALTQYQGHLEALVSERTEELKQANQKLIMEIDEHEQAENALSKSEAMYRDLVESANSVILRWDSTGVITFINKFALQFFGYEHEEIVGQNIVGTIVPALESSGRDLSSLSRDIVNNPEAYIKNINENITKSGQRVWVAWTNKPLLDENGQLLEILSIGNDITKLVEAEKDLAQAKDRAESADRLKSAFLATMSHELRTPLNSIIGFTGILIQRLVGPLNEEQDKQLNMVYNSSKHLLNLINDVLDISKIEADQLNVIREEFELRASVEKVIKSARPLADKKGLDLSFSIAADIDSIKSDRRRVEQILLNLISNAIKFTELGFARVTCESADNGSKIIMAVQDSGIGIKEEDMGILFNAFRQIETGITRKYEGTGLGLSICKKLAHLLGGEIRVESEWGTGSTFSLILPKEGEMT